MHRALPIGLVSLLLAVPAAAQQVEPDVFVLENGMTFLLLPRSEQPNAISAGWVAKVGSVNERPGITGISHFFEHMMFKGTTTIGTTDAEVDRELMRRQEETRLKLRELTFAEQYPRWRRGEIDDPWDPKHDTEVMKKLRATLKLDIKQQAQITTKNEFDQIYTSRGGTGMNAFTSHDLTFYFIKVPSNKLELWAWMESDRLHDSVFREFYAERDVVHEERRMRTESTPTGVFQEQFEAMFWQSSPYSWPVIGWPSDLNSYTYQQATDYYATYYRPGNLVGVIVGDFQLEPTKSNPRPPRSGCTPRSTPPPRSTSATTPCPSTTPTRPPWRSWGRSSTAGRGASTRLWWKATSSPPAPGFARTAASTQAPSSSPAKSRARPRRSRSRPAGTPS
jgi:predicted Zn-dependent peptidase